MKVAEGRSFRGEAISWEFASGTIELTLDRAPCNEIGSVALGELEQFVVAMRALQDRKRVV